MERIKGVDFSINKVLSEYDDVYFEGCNFLGVVLSGINFSDCKFENCDLSNANIAGTTFSDVEFINCKMIGLRFDSCNEFIFLVSFKKCQLDYCSFYNRKMTKTKVENCRCLEVDFTNAQLANSSFSHTELMGASFENTNLEGVDFRGASSYLIRPEINNIKGAKFNLDGLPGLLTEYKIKVE